MVQALVRGPGTVGQSAGAGPRPDAGPGLVNVKIMELGQKWVHVVRNELMFDIENSNNYASGSFLAPS